jgi:RNA polymerase sigma-70 factor (ECF subfamily)
VEFDVSVVARPPSPTSPFEKKLVCHLASLQKSAWRFEKNHADCNDLVQDTLCRALEFQHKYDGSQNMEVWLFTIMKNLFIDRYRLRHHNFVSMSEIELEPLATMQPSQEWNIRVLEAQKNISLMPLAVRISLVQIGLGFSYQEVSEIISIDVNTIKSHVFRARQSLLATFGSTAIH